MAGFKIKIGFLYKNTFVHGRCGDRNGKFCLNISGQDGAVAKHQANEVNRMLFTPRLYTEDTWGSVLAVDNFNYLPCYHTR